MFICRSRLINVKFNNKNYELDVHSIPTISKSTIKIFEKHGLVDTRTVSSHLSERVETFSKEIELYNATDEHAVRNKIIAVVVSALFTLALGGTFLIGTALIVNGGTLLAISTSGICLMSLIGLSLFGAYSAYRSGVQLDSNESYVGAPLLTLLGGPVFPIYEAFFKPDADKKRLQIQQKNFNQLFSDSAKYFLQNHEALKKSIEMRKNAEQTTIEDLHALSGKIKDHSNNKLNKQISDLRKSHFENLIAIDELKSNIRFFSKYSIVA